MKVLAIEKEIEGITWSTENDTLEKEALQVYQLYLSGYLREIYFNEQHCAVLILECESIDKANELLSSLPLVIKNRIKFELMQLNPYTGYERILIKKHPVNE